MGLKVIYAPFLLAKKRPLNTFCRTREREHCSESSEEEQVFEDDCQWEPGNIFANLHQDARICNHLK